MSSTATPAAGSAPASAPATVPVPAPSVSELRAAAANTPLSDLDALLAAPAGTTPATPDPQPGSPAAPEPVAPAPEPPAAPAAPVPPATPEPPKAPTDQEEPSLEKLGRFRFTARTYQEAEVMRLMHPPRDAAGKPIEGAKGLSMQEAFAKVYGPPATAAAAAPSAPAEPSEPAAAPAAPQDAAITAAEAEIKAIDAKLETAYDDADVREVGKLTLDRSRKEREIERLTDAKNAEVRQAEAQREESAISVFRQKELAAANEIKAQFPVLGDRASKERRAFDEWLSVKRDDPDYAAIFASPRWPIVVARDFAEETGMKPAVAASAAAPAAAPATPPTPPPAASRTTSATVLTPGNTNPGQALTPAQFTADVKKMTTQQLDQILASVS